MRKIIFLATIVMFQVMLPNSAKAAIIYDWIGYCSFGCDTVTGELTLKDSFDGFSTSNPADFVSFKFNTMSGTITLDEFLEPFSINGYGHFRDTETASGLFLESGGVFTLTANGRGGYFATGSYSDFILRVPEPSTMALMGMALFGLFVFARRQRRFATSPS